MTDQCPNCKGYSLLPSSFLRPETQKNQGLNPPDRICTKCGHVVRPESPKPPTPPPQIKPSALPPRPQSSSTPTRGSPIATDEELKELYTKTQNIAEIARHLNIFPSAIRKRLARLGAFDTK